MIAEINDIRYDGVYPVAHAAQYLGLNPSTLRSWVKGRFYPLKDGSRRFSEPVIKIPASDASELSFINLVEAHVLSSMRLKFRINMDSVREAINYAGRHSNDPHPLANADFETDGVGIFIEHLGSLIEVSRKGQIVMRELMENSLKRIERDTEGLAAKLYPYTREATGHQKIIVIDPRVSFGRPTLVGAGVSTAIIIERWYAGDPISMLANEYGLKFIQVEEALWYEKGSQRAA